MKLTAGRPISHHLQPLARKWKRELNDCTEATAVGNEPAAIRYREE
jgi:hypothetical protein